ncbi:MAG: energy transducer TonB [Bacteroidetes bacterium]|nr:energy transducer TonB [Bacteroidota bacterium]
MHYFRSISFILFFILTVPAARAQLFGGPEKTAKAFIRAINDGNYEKAASYCILELREDMQRDIEERSYRRGRRYYFEIFDCATAQTLNGVDCECGTYIDGHYSLLIFAMTEVDGRWKIYGIDSAPINRELRTKKKREKMEEADPSDRMSPEETIALFAVHNQAGRYKKAGAITIMAAHSYLLAQISEDSGSLPVSVTNVVCYQSERKQTASCSCDQQTASGKKEAGYYKLVLIDSKWKILEYGTSTGAEGVVTRFVMALANGHCEEAKTMAFGVAAEHVQGSIDAGCASYQTEIMSVECYEEGDTTICSCKEKRDGMEMTFEYELAVYDGLLLIADYQKDLNLDMGEEGIVETEETTDGETETVVEQDENAYEDKSAHEMVVLPDVEASFPGGKEALSTFLKTNLMYPPRAKEEGVSGVVYLMFTVSEDGIISDVRVVKGVNADLDAESLRLVYAMPAWIPGTVAGKNVASYYTLPIRFSLDH